MGYNSMCWTKNSFLSQQTRHHFMIWRQHGVYEISQHRNSSQHFKPIGRPDTPQTNRTLRCLI